MMVLSSDSFQIMAYNVYFLPRWVYPLLRPVRRAEMLVNSEVLQGHDVVILNELFDRKAARTLLHGLAKEYPHQTEVMGKKRCANNRFSCTNGGVAIVSRWPIVHQEEVPFTAGRCGIDMFANKGFIYAQIKQDDHLFHVIATHLQSNDLRCRMGRALSIRQEQMDQIRQFIQGKQIPKNEFLFIGGDFNVDRWNEVEYQDMLDRFNVSPPHRYTGISYTWDTEENSLAGYVYPSTLREYLDYVLVSKDHAQPVWWENEAIHTRSPEWLLGCKRRKSSIYSMDYSDHYPVLFRMTSQRPDV